MLTLLFGWLGAHKFYVGNANGGAIYFAVTVLGFIFTVYEPLWVTFSLFGKDLSFNLGILILIAPLVVSVIEFFLLQSQDEVSIQNRYHTTGEPLTLVFVAQFIYIIILFIPLVYKGFLRSTCNFSLPELCPEKFTYLDSPSSFLSL
jgi:TM2 domain-containing protein